jgi:hypothetical protein
MSRRLVAALIELCDPKNGVDGRPILVVPG